MDFKAGLVVSMRHYSDSNLNKGIILEADFERLTVKFDDNSSFSNFQAGDPVAIGFEVDSMVYISSCNILHVEHEEKKLVIKSDSLETLANKRLFERFPVSFNASVKIGSSKTEHSIIIKNISFNGMLACSKIDFPLYQEMKLDFNIGNLITLKAVIIRKSKEVSHYEYGIKLVYTDPHTPVIIKKYLQQLKKEQESYVNNMNRVSAAP
jgi:hypothetical protein